MSDVVLGAAIGVVAAVVGAVAQGIVAGRQQAAAEARGESRQRRHALLEARLRALDQAHRMLVVGAEYARASAVGEDAQQIASLRRQSESSNYLEADVTLVGDPETVASYLHRTRWWLSLPERTPVSESDLAADAELANRLQAVFRKARERIIDDARTDAGS